MATTNVSIRMDKDLKQQAEIIFDQMGMNMTTAITIFTKAVVRQGKIPFEISIDPFWGAENQTGLTKSIKNLEAGKGLANEITEEDSQLPLPADSDIEKLLIGSVTESLIGMIPHSSATLEDYRADRKRESDGE